MQCIGCGVALSGAEEVHCESCRRLRETGGPLASASHPVASRAAESVVCAYCGERNRLVPGRVRLRCGKCNTQLPAVGSTASALARSSPPRPALPPRERAEPRSVASGETGPAAARSPQRVPPLPPERAAPRSIGGRTAQAGLAPWARNGLVWLSVTLAGQAALAATLPPLVELVAGVQLEFPIHAASFWSLCAAPTAVSILGWLAAVRLVPALERGWALFAPAWLSWVALITGVATWLVRGRASAGTLAWALLLAVSALLPRISLRRLGLGSVLGPAAK